MKAVIARSVIAMLALSWVGTPNIRAEINEWTRLPWPEGGAVQHLLIDPQNPNTLYATGPVYNVTLGGGIFKSTNSGANWRSINFGLATTAVTSLAIVPQNTNVLYAGTWTSGVFKSIDGGESWGTTDKISCHYKAEWNGISRFSKHVLGGSKSIRKSMKKYPAQIHEGRFLR